MDEPQDCVDTLEAKASEEPNSGETNEIGPRRAANKEAALESALTDALAHRLKQAPLRRLKERLEKALRDRST